MAGFQTPQSQFKLLKEFKQQLKAKVKHLPHPSVHLEVFPGNPCDLPAELWKSAYGESPEDEDKPVGNTEGGVTQLLIKRLQVRPL